MCRVRLRGKDANRDTLLYKRDFEVAAAEYAAKSTGRRKKSAVVPKQLSPEWHSLRDVRLTASTFGNALG